MTAFTKIFSYSVLLLGMGIKM